jgi:hypothetical protein
MILVKGTRREARESLAFSAFRMVPCGREGERATAGRAQLPGMGLNFNEGHAGGRGSSSHVVAGAHAVGRLRRSRWGSSTT